MRCLLLILFFLTPTVWGRSIIQVNRALKQSAKAPLPEKDYFLDAGYRDGYRQGDILAVYRMFPVADQGAHQLIAPLRIFMGEVKLIQVGEATSYARQSSKAPEGTVPGIVLGELMLGDEVELKKPQ